MQSFKVLSVLHKLLSYKTVFWLRYFKNNKLWRDKRLFILLKIKNILIVMPWNIFKYWEIKKWIKNIYSVRIKLYWLGTATIVYFTKKYTEKLHYFSFKN